MTVLRSIVLASSVLQLVLAAALAWWLLRVEVPDLVAFGLSAVLVLTALGGLAAAGGRCCRGTVRMNLIIPGLVLALGAAMAIVERTQGVSVERVTLIAEIALVVAAPFLANACALRGLSRRAAAR